MKEKMNNENRISGYKAFRQGFVLFLKSGKFSLIFILLTIVLLKFMGQGGILFVDLLDHNGVNLAVFFLITHFFCLVLSHYPTYLAMGYQASGDLDGSIDPSDITWRMHFDKLCTGFGVITFERTQEPDGFSVHDSNLARVRRWSDLFRGLLGAGFYCAFLYLTISLANKYLSEPVLEGDSIATISPALGVVFVLLAVLVHFVLSYVKAALEKIRDNENFTGKDQVFKGTQHVNKHDHPFWTKLKSVFLILFWSSIVLTISTILVSHYSGWGELTVKLFFWTEVVSLFSFIVFRFVRIRFSEKKWYHFPFFILKEHRYFLLSMSITGWVCVSIFVLAHVDYSRLNPIVLIVAIYYVVSGLLVLPTKHYFYYTSRELDNGKKADEDCEWTVYRRGLRTLFKYVYPLAPFILLALFLIGSFGPGNGLHKVLLVDDPRQVEQSEQGNADRDTTKWMQERDYRDWLTNALQPDDPRKAQEPIYFIASFGGGLMANYWNLRVLNLLDSISADPRDTSGLGSSILENTVAMSGVSGGALGQAFFLPLIDQTNAVRKERIATMGRTNPLTLDLAYTVGYDFVRKILIGKENFQHQDRAGRVMSEYAEEQDDLSMVQESFRSYWYKLYENRDSELFPVLISNSTGIRNTRGVACSIEFEDFSSVFPNSQDILDPRSTGKTPTYLGAVSCTNRFPLLSPQRVCPGTAISWTAAISRIRVCSV